MVVAKKESESGSMVKRLWWRWTTKTLLVDATLEQVTGWRVEDCVLDRSRTPPTLMAHVCPVNVCERERAGETGAMYYYPPQQQQSAGPGYYQG